MTARDDEEARQTTSLRTTGYIAVAVRLIATAIIASCWRIVAQLKAHNPCHQREWSAVDRAANNAVKMAAPLTQ